MDQPSNQQPQQLQSQHNNEEQVICEKKQFQFEEEKLYTLPKMIQFDFRNQEYYQKKSKCPEKFLPIIEQIEQFLLLNLKIWEIEKEEKFTFNLPETVFQEGSTKKIEYLQQGDLQEEYTEVQRLTNAQLDQIKENGTFEVESKIFPDPYVWQINPLIIKGKQNVQISLESDLSLAFHQLYQIQQRLDCPQYTCWLFSINLNSSVQSIFYSFVNLVNLFFGLERQFNVSKLQIDQELEINRQKAMMNKQRISEINIALFQLYLEIYSIQFESQQEQTSRIQEINQQLLQINQDFFTTWNDQQKKVEEQKYKDDMSNYQGKLREAKYNFLFQFIKQSKVLSQNCQEHILEMINTQEIINEENIVRQDLIQKQIENYQKQLQAKHKIKSQVTTWLENKVNKKRQIITKQVDAKFYESVRQRLENKGLQSSLFFLMDFLQFCNNYNDLYNQNIKKLTQKLQKPMRTFKSHRFMCTPYDKKRNYNQQQNKVYWTLEREKEYITTTDEALWRIELIFVRYFCWSFNTSFVLILNAFYFQLSIQAIFRTTEYYYDQQIDYYTGVVSECGYQVKPIAVLFIKVLNGIQESRERFENLPDTGIFGKNFSRIENYIECYVFRFFIVGVLGVLIILPTLILINFLLSIILALTTWLWMPIILIFYYIINNFLYDFDSEQHDIHNNYQNDDRFNNQAFICLPIFAELYRLVFKGILQFIITGICMCIIHPLFSFICVLFAYTRFLLRTLYDNFMYLIILALARQPVIENNIAWKVSGRGVGRKYYYSIAKDDLFILLWAQLEKIELEIYKKFLQEKINEPLEIANSTYKQLFSPFLEHYNNFIVISDKNQLLQHQLDQQLIQRLNIFPILHQLQKIRLTQQELNEYTLQSSTIICDFINRRKLDKSFFAFFSIEDENYNQLIEKIWQRTFNNEILVPIEDIEARFQLKRVEDDYQIVSVQQAITGQVNLNKFNIDVKPQNQNKKLQVFGEFIDLNYLVNRINYDKQPPIYELRNAFFLNLETLQIKGKEKEEIIKISKKLN